MNQTLDSDLLDLLGAPSGGETTASMDGSAVSTRNPAVLAKRRTAAIAAAAADAQQRRITSRIRAALTVSELKDILAETTAASAPAAASNASATASAPALDAICISAAFSQLPKLLRGRRLADGERRDVASLATLHLLPAAKSAMQAGRLDAYGMVSVAVGLAKLEGLGGLEAAEVARLLVVCVQPLLPRCHPQGLSNLIW